MKIGVLGGTFDPVHLAHLAVAKAVKAELGLSEVIFVPAGQPWLKADNYISAAEHRVQMVRLAIAGKSYFRLSTVEIDRPGPSYTVDTMAELREQIGAEDELYFILGWDNLAELPRWREPARLIKLCYLVAVPRPGYPVPDLKKLEGKIPGIARRVIVMDKPQLDISATEIRKRLTRGKPINDLVPEAVAEYIKRHGLYIRA
ncbi:MAG: nicotinate-nucleotide adenylyltransferase [Dehalococcoidia bacterium]|nr:MAG: nicotinate-nucleotide adenylyltransferase [Dehalococcoidia bacterium]